MIDIKAIRAAADVVEWKEWKYVDYSCDAEAGVVSKGGLVALCTGHYAERDNHAKYIATANPATVIAMCDEIERLRKNAARYQFMRDHCARMTVASMSFVECPQSWYSDHDVESNDAAIDEAMGKKT